MLKVGNIIREQARVHLGIEADRQSTRENLRNVESRYVRNKNF